jgi:hypothetical protein
MRDSSLVKKNFIQNNSKTPIKYSFSINHFQLWQDYRPFWMFASFLGAFVMSFQELFNKARFAESTVGNTTVVQMVSDNNFNLIVSYLVLFDSNPICQVRTCEFLISIRSVKLGPANFLISIRSVKSRPEHRVLTLSFVYLINSSYNFKFRKC